MVEGILGAGRSLLRPLVGLRVSGSLNGVSGSRGVFFPGMVFSVPGGFGGSQGVFSSRAGVFSVPRFGFAVPGMVCWAPVGVFCSRNGVSGSRPEGTAWRCLWFPYGVSSCFFLLLCFSLFVASFLFFPFLQNNRRSLDAFFLEPGPHGDSHICVSHDVDSFHATEFKWSSFCDCACHPNAVAMQPYFRV